MSPRSVSRGSGHAAYCARAEGNAVVVGAEMGRVHVYDMRTASKVARVTAHAEAGTVFSLAVTPGRLLTGVRLVPCRRLRLRSAGLVVLHANGVGQAKGVLVAGCQF
jgi:hypothetical protein